MYLLVKNKFTKEWEFPTGKVFGNESFSIGRLNLFKNLTGEKWIARHPYLFPTVATLRPFTEFEKKDRKNAFLSGVRTYYFDAYHIRGLPEFTFENTDYEDYAWVPKPEMNKYFTKERFEVFIDYCVLR